jgi:GT2 family glycosyltransferase/glycosyltransferase involved in cell wall biosynthesis
LGNARQEFAKNANAADVPADRRTPAQEQIEALVRSEFRAASLAQQLRHLEEQFEILKRDKDAKIAGLLSSSSWRLTAPLRAATVALRGLINAARGRPAGVSDDADQESRREERRSAPLPAGLDLEVQTPTAPTDEEWETLAAGWHVPEREPEVDVIVPVYRGLDETMRCLFSVLQARQRTPYRLVVVDDWSPEPDLSKALQRLAERGLIELHRTPQNLGFVGACNLGLVLHPARDVVLLNSDTEVFGDWLDRLKTAAYRGPRTASVTPLSNNAEICSYPHFVQDNRRRLEISDPELDGLAARVNAEAEVDIPTGVGFCMYLRRACLDEVGILDHENFGRGYGEENDLCRRAVSAGWRNILAPNIFVRHHGAISFGPGKLAQVESALKTMERLHPDYLPLVADFIKRDSIKPYRQAIDEVRFARRAGRGAILLVSHSWGGGTERHVQDMARRLELDGVAVFFCRVDPRDGGRIRIEDQQTPETPNLPGFDVRKDLDAFVERLGRIGIGHVHVQHLAGFPTGIPDFLQAACRAAGLAYDVTVHDYMAICPRINLIDSNGVYCGEPQQEMCEVCVRRDGSPFGDPSVWKWRDRFARLYLGARKVFVPDADVARRMRRFMPGVSFVVRPHPEPEIEGAGAPRSGGPSIALSAVARRSGSSARRIVVLGEIGPHKGGDLLVSTARAAASRQLPLEFVVIGFTHRDDELQAIGNTTITGRYEEADAMALLRAAEADLAWFPVVCPETYSYTLSAVFAAGLCPVAFDLGAIASRIRNEGFGELLPAELMLDPATVASRLAALPLHRRAPGSFKPTSYARPLLSSYYELSLARAEDDGRRPC